MEKGGEEERDINKQMLLRACKPPLSFPKPLPRSLSPKSNSLWHKKGEFVLMFVEN